MTKYSVYVQRTYVRWLGDVDAASPMAAKLKARATFDAQFRPCPDCIESSLGEEIDVNYIFEEILTSTDGKEITDEL
jgi:hypothetical protein